MEEPVNILKKAREDFTKGNYSISFDSYRQYLELNPSDSEARKEYRENCRSSPQFRGKSAELVKKHIDSKKINMIFREMSQFEVMKNCEELLKENPYDISLLFKLGKTAKEIGFNDTAVYTFSDMIEHVGNNELILKELALTYFEMKKYREAKEAFNKYDTSKEQQDVRKKIDGLDALITAQKYEQAQNFRQVEKAPGKSDELEKARETPKNEEEILKKISELELIVGNEKENGKKRLSAVIEISGLQKRICQYDEAVAILERGKSLGGDYTLDKSIVELKIEKEDNKIAQLEEQMQKEPNDGLKAQLDQMIKNKWEIAAEGYSKLIGKIPTAAPELHLKLGEGCFYLGTITKNHGLIEKAIFELQKEYIEQGQKNKASILMGKAFVEMQLYDLAEKHFVNMLGEVSKNKVLKQLTLETFYELGNIRLLKGDIRGAVDAFSEIYIKDINFKDVARKVLELNKKLK
ncbi:hypothetical protein HYU07_06895 [Candidatus Woesearchaeota archaeon]|nr:hypothetical protein [Candidatus Woesearchaeota archaeon]